MPSVNIEGIGTVQFPDEMSHEDIVSAIKDNILPKAAKRQLVETIGSPETPQRYETEGPESMADVGRQTPEVDLSTPEAFKTALRNPDTHDIAVREAGRRTAELEQQANTPLVNIPAEPFELGVGVPLPQFVKKFSNDFTRRAAENVSGFTSPEALTEAAALAPLGAVKYALPAIGLGIGTSKLSQAAGEYSGGESAGTSFADAVEGLAFGGPGLSRSGAAILRRSPTLREAIRRRMNPIVEPPIEEQFAKARNITPERPPAEPTTEGGPNAVQEPTATEGVLRQERSEVGLPRVEPRNGPAEGEAGAEVEDAGGLQPRGEAVAALDLTPTKLEQLRKDLNVQINDGGIEQGVSVWHVTPEDPGPQRGGTFSVPKDATEEQLLDALTAKVEQFEQGAKTQVTKDNIDEVIRKAQEEASADVQPTTPEQKAEMEVLKKAMRNRPVEAAPVPNPPPIVPEPVPPVPIQPPPVPPPRRRPQRPERPPDIVDDIIGSVGKISQKSWAEAHQSQGGNESFNRRMLTSQVLRNLVSRRGGRDLDQVLTDLHASGMHQDITNSEGLKGAIEQAMAVRKSKAPAKEAKLLDLQERVHAALTSPNRKKGQRVADDPIPASGLNVGDKFMAAKVPVRVSAVDADTGQVQLIASGAPHEIHLENDDPVYPDKGGLKRFKPDSTDTTPFAKIQRPAGRNIFQMSDAELEKTVGGSVPQPGQFGRGKSLYSFKDLSEFEKWMDERYAERDLQSMSEGYRDVDAKLKVGYIKANRGAAAHKQAWISHMATGSPLPPEDPPITPTAPPPYPPSMGTRPAPKPGGPTQPGTRGPARPGAPPPPPRGPSDRAPFDIQALVQLLRRFDTSPRINKLLKDAYGHYVRGDKLVELKQRMLWDTQLATEVLSHEIGHFVDMAIEERGAGKEIGARWAPLHEFKNSLFKADDIKKEAKALSAAWRGPFTARDRYRNSASELFADAMSSMLTKPEWVNQNFPLIHDTFQNLLNGKPAFRQAWESLNANLRVGKLGADVQGQLDEAFRKSVQDFAHQQAPEKISFRDAVRRNLMSKWFRAFDIEGRPRALADRMIDKLEDNDLMSVRASALLANRFLRDVQPAINGINPNPEKGRLTLAKWLFANRIIQERRASGQWIEQNPTEAKQLLEEILAKVPALSSKYLGALQNAQTGTELYDLAGSIFREAHDLGKFTLRRIASIVDKFDDELSGSAMLQALNVRGKLFNPSGYTPQRAQQLIASLRNELTPEQSAALDKAQNAFFDLMQGVVTSAHDLGLISDKAWNELVEPNLRNYVPFAVLEYWDNKVGAGIKPQVGTAKDVADPILAAQLKMGSTFNWMQRQMSVLMLMEAYRRGGVEVKPGQILKGYGALEKIRDQNRHDTTSRLSVWVDGKQRLVEFPDDPGKTFEQAMEKPSFLKDLQLYTHSPIGRGTRSVLSAYTTLSPAFLFYRNAIRDLQTSAQRVGYGPAAKRTANLKALNEARRLAYNYANAAFGEIMDPEIENLVAIGVLPPPQLARAYYRNMKYLDQMIQSGGLTALQVHPERPQDSRHWLPEPVQQAYHHMEKFSAMMEAIPKIQTYYAALDSGLTPEEAQAFARRAGIPNPAIGGKWSGFVEGFMPWTRITIQGHRTTLDILRDQKRGAKFGGRVFTFEILPRIMRYLIATGVIAHLLQKKDDKEEDKSWLAVVGEHYKRTSPYKAALDNMIPVGWRDPRTKEFIPLYKTFGKSANEIPKHWEAVSFRMPSSEEGKHWGSLTYAILSGTSENTKIGGKGPVENVGNWATGIMLPGENPAFSIASHQYDLWMKGMNPTDSFRQQPVANPELFKAGGGYRAQANLGALFKETGGPGQLASQIGQWLGLDPRATDVTKRGSEKPAVLSNLPITSAAFSFDNYAPIRDAKEAQAAQEKYGTRARMLMDSDARELYDYYTTHLQKTKDMDAYQRDKFEWAKSWHQQVWGNLNQEGYYYNRAVNAVGPDGSKEQIDTVKRDVKAASEVFVNGFNSVK